MKLVPIIMDYCLLQFDALKFSVGARLHGGGWSETHQIWQQNRKVHGSTCLDTNFYNISDIVLRVIRRRNYNECEDLTTKFLLLNNSGVAGIFTFFIHTTII